MNWEMISDGRISIGKDISFPYIAYINRNTLKALELAGEVNSSNYIFAESPKLKRHIRRQVEIERAKDIELGYSYLSKEILEEIDGLKEKNIKSQYIKNYDGVLMLRVSPVHILKKTSTFEEGKALLEKIIREDNLEELIALGSMRGKNVV